MSPTKILLFCFALICYQWAQAQIANDECNGAIFLGPVEGYCSNNAEFTTVGATTSPQAKPFCQPDSIQRDVWFSFRATATNVSVRVIGSLLRDGGGSLRNPQIGLYSGTSCAEATDIACVSDAFSANVVGVLADNLLPGEIYFIRVGARDGQTGSFKLCLEQFDYVPSPASDCVDGVLLCDKNPFTVTQLIDAGNDRNEIDPSSCLKEEFSSVWYRWTCDEAGDLSFTLTPSSPVDDLDFAVYELPGGIDDCAGKRMLRCMASGENVSAPLSDWERCSGDTGLRSSEGDTDEQPGCDRGDNNFVQSINMVAGRSYALIVNNFSESGNGFSIVWSGSGTFVGPKANFTFDPQSGGQCDTDEFTFTNNSTPTPGAQNTYEWFFGNFASRRQVTGEGPHVNSYGAFGEKTITLRLTSSDGCVVTETKKLYIEPCCESSEPLVAGDALTINPACPGTPTGSFDIPIISGVPNYFFSLDGGPYLGNSEVTGLNAGDYTVYIQNIKGCMDTVEVRLNDPPEVEVEIGNDRLLSFGESFTVSSLVNLAGPFTYSWSGVDSIVCLNAECTDVRVFPNNPGQVELLVVSELGCQAFDRLQFDIRKERPLYAPTAFSPNGDLNNDRWTLFGPEVLERINYIRIFDRWGEQVWEGVDLQPNDVEAGWDGRYQDRELNPGVFAYVAEVLYVDGIVLNVTGDINLMR